MREVCYKARELLIEEGNVVGVDAPVTVGLPVQRKKTAFADWKWYRSAAISTANSTI